MAQATTKKTTKRSGNKRDGASSVSPETSTQGGKDSPRRGARGTTAQKKSTRKRARSGGSPRTQAAGVTKELRAAARAFDRESITTRIRVHALAKQLGTQSKILIPELAELGLKKVAQSTLSAQEAGALLDALGGNGSRRPSAKSIKKSERETAKKTGDAAPPRAEDAPTARDSAAGSGAPRPADTASAPHSGAGRSAAVGSSRPSSDPAQAQPAGPDRGAEELGKIRYRVEKGVENEIHQIEQKVDASLMDKLTETGEDQQDAPAESAAAAHRSDAETAHRSGEEAADSQEKAVTKKREKSAPKKAVREKGATKKTAPRKNVSGEKSAEKTTQAKASPAKTPSPNSAFDDATDDRASVDRASGEEGAVADPGRDEAASRHVSRRGRARRSVRRRSGGAGVETHETDADEQSRQPGQPASREDADTAHIPYADDAEGVNAANSAAEADSAAPEGARDSDAAHGVVGDTAPADAPGAPEDRPEEPVALRGSTRLEAKRRRRSARSAAAQRAQRVVSQAEFLARRESVDRTMVVRERRRHDGPGTVTQVGILEDGILVEHVVTSETQSSIVGNVYLGRVQNVLSSMEAAFIDIGQGRNGVLYAGEVDWRAAGLGGAGRRIERALKPGDQIVVQVTKDPVGHKGARLTTQVSLAGRYLVYVPGGRSSGISRKLPVQERGRLKKILKHVMPTDGGAIIRTAAEGIPEEAIAADVRRLHEIWEDIQRVAAEEKESDGSKPVALYEEPEMLIKAIRDLYNEDFNALIVDGERPWKKVSAYVESVAPDLADRMEQYDCSAHEGRDAFVEYRVDEQLQKALSRLVWLPSGGSLVIEHTEAMTVIDVNTGKFIGSGGNLEETVTRNNLEAAEEIVRQLRLRDIGGMIVIDFIDMVLPENRELVLRRLTEALGRDRTRHQVSEVTSLGLVQLTRKRLGTGLLDTFATRCETCGGRGIVLHDDPVEATGDATDAFERRGARRGGAQSHHGGETEDQGEARAREESGAREPHAGGVGPERGNRDRQDREDSAGRGGRRRHARRRGQQARPGGARAPEEAMDEAASQDPSDEELVAAVLGGADAHDSEPEAPRGDGAGRPGPDASPSAATHAPRSDGAEAPTSYEEALREFESSPRRKRRTRGHSRSDRAPRPEDFIVPEPEEGEGRGMARGEEGAVEDASVGSATEQVSVMRRGRRRRAIRRRVVARRGGAASSAGSASSDERAPRGRGDAPGVVSHGDGEPGEARRRGRRRATRRSTRRRG